MLPRKVEGAPSLKVFKVGLDGALSKLFQRVASCSWQEGWGWTILNVPSNPSLSMVLLYDSLNKKLLYQNVFLSLVWKDRAVNILKHFEDIHLFLFLWGIVSVSPWFCTAAFTVAPSKSLLAQKLTPSVRDRNPVYDYMDAAIPSFHDRFIQIFCNFKQILMDQTCFFLLWVMVCFSEDKCIYPQVLT